MAILYKGALVNVRLALYKLQYRHGHYSYNTHRGIYGTAGERALHVDNRYSTGK
jgi:hypothetical protein